MNSVPSNSTGSDSRINNIANGLMAKAVKDLAKSSNSFWREVAIKKKPLSKQVKTEESNENPATLDLGERVCRKAEACSSSQNSLTKSDQIVEMGNIKYTHHELAEISTRELNLLLKNENDEIMKHVKSTRRAEKNRQNARISRKKSTVILKTISEEINALKLRKKMLELENKKQIEEIESMTFKCEALERVIISQPGPVFMSPHTKHSTIE